MKQIHDIADEAAGASAAGDRLGASAALDRLFELAEVLGDLMERGMAERGVTRARAGLLWALLHGGPMTQRALATRLRVTPRNVTGLLDALQADGFVSREPHPADRRATLVSLTAAGHSLTAELRAGRDELAAQLFAGMPEARTEAFAGVLGTVIDRLRAVDAG